MPCEALIQSLYVLNAWYNLDSNHSQILSSFKVNLEFYISLLDHFPNMHILLEDHFLALNSDDSAEHQYIFIFKIYNIYLNKDIFISIKILDSIIIYINIYE